MKRSRIILFIFIALIFFLESVNIKNIMLKKIYPIRYKEYVYKYSTEYEIDPFLIYSIIKTESNFNEKSISTSGAIGLMQLMDSTAEEIAEKQKINYLITDLYNPEINIKFGIKYYSELNEYYNNIYLTLAAYNAGIGNVNKWIESGIIKKDGSNVENIPFKETSNYIRKVLRNYKIYQELYKE